MKKQPMSILITGASSGIGQALAVYYAKNPNNILFINGRNKVRLNKTKTQCEKLGAKVYAKIIDVTNKEKMQQWVEECEQISPLNLIIANAGVATVEESSDNIFNTFNTNINGVLNTVVPALEIFKTRADNKKQIAIMSSIAAYHGLASCPSYSASKACVKAYGEGLRGNMRPFGIKVNVVCPGFIRSRITDRKNYGLISFPQPMRFAAWFMSVLPNFVSDFIYSRLPHKV